MDTARTYPKGYKMAAVNVDSEELADVVRRLRRAQGQIGGVIRMIEDGQECSDVVTQLAAAARALDRAGFKIIASGLCQCVLDEQAGREEATAERARLEKEMSKVEADIKRVDAKLGNADFLARAPEEVVEGEREKRDEAQARKQKIVEALERLKGAA